MNVKLYSLVRYLQKPGGVSIEELQEGLNISRATVFRYLGILEKMNLPVTFETRGKKNYYFFDMSNEFVGRNIFESLPYLKDDFIFDKNEKMLIEYLFSNTEATVPTLKKDIEKLHDKMQVLLSFAGHISSDQEENIPSLPKRREIRKIYSFNDMPKKTEQDKMDIISKLSDAVAEKRVCIVTYRAAEGKEEKTYKIMPLIVFTYMGGIYTIVETEKYEYTAKLAVERIKKLEVTNETFSRKTTLDLSHTLTDPFGLVQTDQFEAVILIKKDSVERIKDKAWPEDRVTFSAPDENGNVILKVVTSGEFELLRWLRYMGGEVKLLEPAFLVDKLKQSILDLNRIYF